MASDRLAEEALMHEVPEVGSAPPVSWGGLVGLSLGPAGVKATSSLLALRGLASGAGDDAALAPLVTVCLLVSK